VQDVKKLEFSRRTKRGHFKFRINELEADSKNKNITGLHRGTKECKIRYGPRSNLVKKIIMTLLQFTQCPEQAMELFLSLVECTWGL
jgi:hypothetical protein